MTLATSARSCCTRSVPGSSRLKKRTLSHVTTGKTAIASTASERLVITSSTNAPTAISRYAELIGMFTRNAWISRRSALPRDISWPVAVRSW
ncbi:MAG: hypothetical protein KatS3mg064_1314 [Tepidiforma sp.]|nr:hypothetical protein [Tepidiforma sp.]GIW18157.1 MAG: hypothetical protein KatS3mg064_1314 [Tepidiforma sp.]